MREEKLLLLSSRYNRREFFHSCKYLQGCINASCNCKKMKLPAKSFVLELWLIIGLLLMLVGVFILGWIIVRWVMTGYGELSKIRLGASAMLVVIMGMQTIMNAMVISMMDIKVDRR